MPPQGSYMPIDAKPWWRRWFVWVVCGVSIFSLWFIVLCIDGAAYDRWSVAKELVYALRAWRKDGSPPGFDILKYGSLSKSHTMFRSNEPFVVDGETYRAFIGIKSQRRIYETFFITTNGTLLIQPDGGRVRLLKMHANKAGAP